MTALFGSEVEGELFSPCNGLLLHDCIEERSDAGLFVIVPDVDRGIRNAMEVSANKVERCLTKELDKILDWSWPKLDHTIDWLDVA
jgi:hypothetical protein